MPAKPSGKCWREMGFKVSDNFNPANESDYKYIRNKLNQYKNNMTERAAEISTVNHSNPVVRSAMTKRTTLGRRWFRTKTR